MSIESLFRQVQTIIADQQFEQLPSLNIVKPQKFNWVREIFEAVQVKEQPEATALLWTDGTQTQSFSFLDLQVRCNQYVNFLRNHGLATGAVIYSQMPLLPENWLTILAAIKGGFRLIPAATILSVHDIVYRFGKLLPEAVIADADNAQKIDEAEELSGKPLSLKIIVGGARPGWVSFEAIYQESPTAQAADTLADDPLFLFFTSGTTGMPKVVTHTHTSYPLGHLSTAAWIGLRKGDVHYNISQPGWAKFAWSSFFAPWNMGATIFAFNQLGRFNAQEQLQLLEKHRVTTFCAPPTALRMLIIEDLSAYHFSLRECVAAGEPLNPEIIEIWKKVPELPCATAMAKLKVLVWWPTCRTARSSTAPWVNPFFCTTSSLPMTKARNYPPMKKATFV